MTDTTPSRAFSRFRMILWGLVNHTASVFLINKDGSFEGTISYGEAKDTAVAKIKKLIEG